MILIFNVFFVNRNEWMYECQSSELRFCFKFSFFNESSHEAVRCDALETKSKTLETWRRNFMTPIWRARTCVSTQKWRAVMTTGARWTGWWARCAPVTANGHVTRSGLVRRRPLSWTKSSATNIGNRFISFEFVRLSYNYFVLYMLWSLRSPFFRLLANEYFYLRCRGLLQLTISRKHTFDPLDPSVIQTPLNQFWATYVLVSYLQEGCKL